MFEKVLLLGLMQLLAANTFNNAQSGTFPRLSHTLSGPPGVLAQSTLAQSTLEKTTLEETTLAQSNPTVTPESNDSRASRPVSPAPFLSLLRSLLIILLTGISISLMVQLSRQRRLIQAQQIKTRKAQLFADIASAPISTLSDLEPALAPIWQDARDILQADRIVFYRVKTNQATLEKHDWVSDWQHYVNTEGWVASEAALLDKAVASTRAESSAWLPADATLESQASPLVFNDVVKADIDDRHRHFLAELSVRASLSVPVFHDKGADAAGHSQEVLWGYIIVHHCDTPRDWQGDELNFVQKIADQLRLVIYRLAADINIQRSHQKTQLSRQVAEKSQLAARRSQLTTQALTRQTEALAREKQQQLEAKNRQTQQLQQALDTLTNDIARVFQGDLTTRTRVTEGQLKATADVFNGTVAGLEEFVTQIKQPAQQVSRFLVDYESIAAQIAAASQQQIQETQQLVVTLQQAASTERTRQEAVRLATQAAHVVATHAAAEESAMRHAAKQIHTLPTISTQTIAQIERLLRSANNVSYMSAMVSEIATDIQTVSKQATQSVDNWIAEATTTETIKTSGSSAVNEHPIALERYQTLSKAIADMAKLAERAITESQLIDTFLSSVTTTTTQVAEEVTQINQAIASSTQAVQQSQESLSEVLSASRQFQQLSDSIAGTTQNQFQASQIAFEQAEAMASMSEQIAGISQEIAKALQTTVHASQALQSAVNVFQVSQSNGSSSQ